MSRRRKSQDNASRGLGSADNGTRWPVLLGALLLAAWTALILKFHYGSTHLSFPALGTAAESLIPRLFPFAPGMLLRHAARLLGLGWLLLAAWGAGGLVTARLGVSWDDAFEESALRLGLGFGVLAYAVLGLGLAGLLHVPVLWGLLGVLATAGLWRPGTQAAFSLPGRDDSLGAVWKGVFPCLLALAALAELPFLLSPEVAWDPLVYHLNLPHSYLQHHRIHPTPANIFSGNLMTVQMLYVPALTVGGTVVAKLLNAFFGLAHLLLFAAWARRWGRPGTGMLASVFFLLCPIVLYEEHRTSVGLAWSFFQLCSFHCLMRAAGCEGAGTACAGRKAAVPGGGGDGPLAGEFPGRRSWWILTGIFLGLAMGSKYVAWLLPASLLLAAGLSRVRRLGLPEIRLRETALALVIALAMISPWALRNVLFYGDPVFPFLTSKYAPGGDGLCEPAPSCDLPPREDKGLKTWTKGGRPPDLKSLKGIGRYLLHPWRFSTHVVDRHSEFLSPLYLILLPLALLLRGPPGAGRFLGILILGAWLPMSLFAGLPRYFIAMLAPLSGLLAWAVLGVRTSWLRNGILAMAAWVLGVNILMTFHPPVDQKVFWDVISGRTPEPDFLAHDIFGVYPHPPYEGIRWINENAPPDAKVLLVADARGIHLERPYYSNTRFDVDIMERLFNCGADPEAIRERLLGCGVRYLLVNRAEFYRMGLNYRMLPKGAANYHGFWKTCTEKVFESYVPPDRWVVVFRVLDKGESPDPEKAEHMLTGPSQQSPSQGPPGERGPSGPHPSGDRARRLPRPRPSERR